MFRLKVNLRPPLYRTTSPVRAKDALFFSRSFPSSGLSACFFPFIFPYWAVYFVGAFAPHDDLRDLLTLGCWAPWGCCSLFPFVHWPSNKAMLFPSDPAAQVSLLCSILFPPVIMAAPSPPLFLRDSRGSVSFFFPPCLCFLPLHNTRVVSLNLPRLFSIT